jgi:hypothetical protein
MREARAFNHPAYAFLSLYCVLEVAFEDRRARGAWMTEQLDHILDPRARGVIARLRAEGVAEIGVHLQTSGRQAIAHARHKPIINPDDPADHRRLSQELPLIEALALRANRRSVPHSDEETVFPDDMRDERLDRRIGMAGVGKHNPEEAFTASSARGAYRTHTVLWRTILESTGSSAGCFQPSASSVPFACASIAAGLEHYQSRNGPSA